MIVLITGTPTEGFMHYGPFLSGEDAAEWAEENVHIEWWVITLTDPKGLDDDYR